MAKVRPALRCAAFWSAAFGTLIETRIHVGGCRWAIEDSSETAKKELGLDLNGTRSWHGWRPHVLLVMPTFATMAAIRHHAGNQSGTTKGYRGPFRSA
ncbi:MAG: hypothetical protein ACLPIX_04760 [Rhodomicrobium sp.]